MFPRWVGALVGLALVGIAGPGNASLYEDDVVCDVAGDPEYSCVYATGGIVGNDVEFYVAYGSTPTLSLDLYESSVEISFMETGSIGSLEIYLGGLDWTDFAAGYIEEVAIVEVEGYEIIGLEMYDIALYPAGGHSLTIDLSGISYNAGDMTQIYFTVYHAEPEPVPEPSTLSLFATGLAGLGFMGWRRRKRVQLKAA